MENKKMKSGQVGEVKPIDDHDLHLNQHIAFMLKDIYASDNVDKKVEQMFLKHIEEHKKAKGE